jgi:hypothetical protein
MYSSLHIILHPLIENTETGILAVEHGYGDKGTICLQKGSISAIAVGGRSGASAARTLAAWLSFSSEFTKTAIVADPLVRGVDARGFLDLLERIHRLAADINDNVPGNDALFKTIARKLDGERSFTPRELQVVMMLDGKTPVRDVVHSLGYPEFEVLYHISNFFKGGFVDLLSPGAYSLSA